MKNISDLIRKHAPKVLIMPWITEDDIIKLKVEIEKEKKKDHNETKIKE